MEFQNISKFAAENSIKVDCHGSVVVHEVNVVKKATLIDEVLSPRVSSFTVLDIFPQL